MADNTPLQRAARAVQAAQFAAIGYFSSLSFPTGLGKKIMAPETVAGRALDHAWLHIASAHALIVSERQPGVDLEKPQLPGRKADPRSRHTKARVLTSALVDAAARGNNVTGAHVIAPAAEDERAFALPADVKHLRLPRQHPLQLPATFGRYRQPEHMPLLYVVDARLACLAVALEQTNRVLRLALEEHERCARRSYAYGEPETPAGDFSLSCVMSVANILVDTVDPGHPDTALGRETDRLMKGWVDRGGKIANAVFTFKPRGARGPYRSIVERAQSLAGLDVERTRVARADVQTAVLEGELDAIDTAEPVTGANVLGTDQRLLDDDADMVAAGSGLGRLFEQDVL